MHNIMYVMGLLVGEGCFTGSPKPTISVKLHARDPKPLKDMQDVLGGKIYGPYIHSGRHYSVLLVRGKELTQAIELINQHMPDSHKRIQFLEWRKKHEL